jgi:hypothetical protein
MANHPDVPAETSAEMSRWGLCENEFTADGHSPREIYVREARRITSDFVMAEPHLRSTKPTHPANRRGFVQHGFTQHAADRGRARLRAEQGQYRGESRTGLSDQLQCGRAPKGGGGESAGARRLGSRCAAVLLVRSIAAERETAFWMTGEPAERLQLGALQTGS